MRSVKGDWRGFWRKARRVHAAGIVVLASWALVSCGGDSEPTDQPTELLIRLEDNAENEAILMGAAMILIGLIAGVIIKSRPQRSAWS